MAGGSGVDLGGPPELAATVLVVGTTRTTAAALLSAILLLVGCGGNDSPSSSVTTVTTAGATTTTTVAATTTTTVAATTTTRSAASIKAALLQASDVPGSTESPAAEGDTDLSACFPGNPFGAKVDPSEVDSPDLEITQGAVQRTYSSSARVGTPDQAKAFVTTFASPEGFTCVLNAFKADLAAPPDAIDASRVTGKPSTVSVGDGGTLLPLTGPITAGGRSSTLSVDLLVFSKGPVVVFMTAGAFGGPVVAGQSLELAKKIDSRLT